MLDYAVDSNGNIYVNNANAIILAEQPAKQSKVTTKNHIIGFERQDGIRIKYDRQTNLLVTYKIVDGHIYIMSCSIEQPTIYEALYDNTFYKMLTDEKIG